MKVQAVFIFLCCVYTVSARMLNTDVPEDSEIRSTSLCPAIDHGIYLAHECVGPTSSSQDKLPVIMLHGFTDVKETWDGIYQEIPLLTGRRVCIYDARNHGDSGWNDTFNLDVMVEDLGKFMADMKIGKASLVGHSFGGLTVMQFALKYPSKVESIFVEDYSPIRKMATTNTDPGVQAFLAYVRVLFDSISAIPAGADEERAKKAVIDYITNVTKTSPQPSIFKRLPLHFKDGVWQWKSNLKAFIRALEDHDSFLGKISGGQYSGRSFFIYGEASPFKVGEDKEDILKIFPNAEFFGVEGADHLVHSHITLYLSKLAKFLNQK